LTQAYDTVKLINDDARYGMILRNIHYHASNAMLLLAIYHLFYQLFSGKYKVKNEVIWVTGVLLGVLTFLEAYTGYDLILNERGVLAINIGASLTNSIPFIGTTLSRVLLGYGFADIVLHFYVFHIVIIPIIMFVLLTIHLPRNLIFDPPMIALISGGIVLAGGLFPVPMGTKFDPNLPPGVTVPEWYITGLYALIRTGIDKFVAGVLIPTLFILYFLIIPFIDKSKSLRWEERPLATGLGIAGLAQIIVTTTWGFYINPDASLDLATRLLIDPVSFYSVLIAIIAVSLGISYGYSRYIYPKRKGGGRGGSSSTKTVYFRLSKNHLYILLGIAIAFQLLSDVLALWYYFLGLSDLAMIWIGMSLIVFGAVAHLVRVGYDVLGGVD
jgi:ubiquinol-cytochrome c reductase cytochrome b subunit